MYLYGFHIDWIKSTYTVLELNNTMQLHVIQVTFPTILVINKSQIQKHWNISVLLLRDFIWSIRIWVSSYKRLLVSGYFPIFVHYCSFGNRSSYWKLRQRNKQNKVNRPLLILGVWMRSQLIEQCYHFFEVNRQRQLSIKLSTAQRIWPST